ncbi:glutathionylspermidine synthase family protein [Natronospora cellulosivora (SeqCode)]
MSKKLHNEYLSIIKKKPEKYYQDYIDVKEKVNNSTAIYKGEPIDFLYQAFFFDKKQYQELEKLLADLISILNKVVYQYKNNKEFRNYFLFSELMEDLILIDPAYKYSFPIGRFDIFYKENVPSKFCELNTDGASAMNEVRVLQEVMLESKVLKDIKKKYNINGFELFYSWIDAIIDNYKEYNNGIDDKPNIAIVDFDGEGTIYEFKEFQKRFIEKGYQTVICDPRELEYRDSELFYKDLKIKLIYRRAISARLVEEADFIRDMLQAYRDGNVCMVGGFVSQIVHNKVLFAILHDNHKTSFLCKKEREFIKKHIPYTEIIDFTNESLIDEIIANKDKWILKPFDLYAAKGVYAGKDYNSEQWEKILDKISGQDYLLQEFIELPLREVSSINNEKIIMENYGFLLGLFTYNNKLKGLYTRSGRKNIIGAIAESFIVPNYLIDK